MFRDRKPDPEESSKFVWNGGAEEQTQQAEKHDAVRERTGHHGRALVAAAVIVPLAGGAVGLVAYENHHATTTVTTADAAQVTPGPASAFVAPSPSLLPTLTPSLSPSPSLTPTKSATPTAAAPTHVVTVVKTVAAPAAKAPTAPRPVAFWTLNHTAADATGAHNGTATKVDWDGGAATFYGEAPSDIVTSGPVLNTGAGHSFTVSASVFLTSIPQSPQYADTAVSQDAGTDSGFYLQYFQPDNCWSFSRVNSDTDNPNGIRAESTSTPQVDVWTNLTGVYAASTGMLYLYVNGVLEGTAHDSTPFASNGPLAIARGFYNGQDSDWFHGLITQVKVFDQALTPSEVRAIA